MTAMFSENAQAVLRFLQANVDKDLTANAIAEAINITPRSANGTITGLQRKGLVERVEVEGIEKKVVRLTKAGATADPAAEKAE